MKQLLLLALMVATGLTAWQCSAQDLPRAEVVIESPDGKRRATVDAELAESPAAQQRGLMHRRVLPKDAGMLFPNDPPREVGFWMKNTLIPLDMIFIGPDWEVSRIAPMAKPHSEEVISSEGPVAAMLEVNGGKAAEWGIQPGDTVAVKR